MVLWRLGSNYSRLGNFRDFYYSLPFQQEGEMGVELLGCRIVRLVRIRYFHLHKLQSIFQCLLQHGSSCLGNIASGVYAEILYLACTNTKLTIANYST